MKNVANFSKVAKLSFYKCYNSKMDNNYSAYVRLKNKMIKMEYSSLYTLTKESFDDTL